MMAARLNNGTLNRNTQNLVDTLSQNVSEEFCTMQFCKAYSVNNV